MSCPIYLRAVFRSFGYLQYSEIIYFFSEEYVSIWEENQDMKIVCIYECAYEEVKKKKKITLGKFWDKIQDSCSWDLPLSCAEGQNLLSSLCLPVQCQISAGPACWRKKREAFEDAAIASKCWAADCVLSEGWVVAKHSPPLLIPALCLGDTRDWLSDLQRSRMDRRLFTLALIPFPLSSSVIICVDQMLLGYLCLTFQLDALYLSLCIDYIKNIATSSTTSCVKIVARGSDCTFYCLRRCLEFSSFYFQYILFAFIILYVLSGVLLL